MRKEIKIIGMNCKHCASKVKSNLEINKDLKAKVDLKNNVAIVSMKKDISNLELIKRIEIAGYTVEEVRDI